MGIPLRGLRLVLPVVVVGVGCLAACGGGDGDGNGASTTDAGVGSDVAVKPVEPTAAAPVITSFTAAKDKLTIGSATTLTAIFTGGTATITEIGAVTSGAPAPTGSLTGDKTYTLVVKGPGGEATRTVSVAAFPAATITSFAAVNPTVTTGTAASLVAVFTGTGTVDKGIGAVTSGTPSPTGNLTADTTYTLTATNPAGDSITQTTAVAVAAAPVITGFTAGSGKISRYTTTPLTATFTGGTGSIDKTVGPVTSGAAIESSKVPALTTFTLTVTNAAGDTATATVDVDAKKELFVVDLDAVAIFDEDATGNVAPKRRITGALTTLSSYIGTVSIIGDELIVNSGNARILTFNVTDDGNVAPKRTISGSNTLLSGVHTAFLYNGELYAAVDTGTGNPGYVSVFNLLDTGNVAPKRRIGPSAVFNRPYFLAVDADEVYVPNFAGGTVTVHGIADVGNVAPKRTITIGGPVGVNVDGAELFVANGGAATVFDKVTGAQLRQIAGGSTSIQFLYNCLPYGTELLCSDIFAHSLTAFPRTGTGNIAPTRALAGASTTLDRPSCMTIR